MLTKEMKVEIAQYVVHFSKGLIESNRLKVAQAYADGEVTYDELCSVVDSMRDCLIEAVQNGEV